LLPIAGRLIARHHHPEMLKAVWVGFRLSEDSAFVSDALLPPAGFGAAPGKWATVSERRHAVGFYFRAGLAAAASRLVFYAAY
jgi:hypothetical protein